MNMKYSLLKSGRALPGLYYTDTALFPCERPPQAPVPSQMETRYSWTWTLPELCYTNAVMFPCKDHLRLPFQTTSTKPNNSSENLFHKRPCHLKHHFWLQSRFARPQKLVTLRGCSCDLFHFKFIPWPSGFYNLHWWHIELCQTFLFSFQSLLKSSINSHRIMEEEFDFSESTLVIWYKMGRIKKNLILILTWNQDHDPKEDHRVQLNAR